ncbi:hypothetical protein RRF57_008080 [Xylaria bambusicola]|uniref:Uncharacterized protein n=1 Tax=Xylaria bambusicola TaxID=326684 RepID=A0AAN7UUQ1_9PEZI
MCKSVVLEIGLFIVIFVITAWVTSPIPIIAGVPVKIPRKVPPPALAGATVPAEFSTRENYRPETSLNGNASCSHARKPIALCPDNPNMLLSNIVRQIKQLFPVIDCGKAP